MKKERNKILFFILLLSGVFGCNGNQPTGGTKESAEGERAGGQPVIEFRSTEHDFGQVSEGEQVGWYFYFKNSGTGDLIIQKVTSSCGCTVPNYSREPVSPGDEGKIQVVYDSSGREGFDSKTIKVETNAGSDPVSLKIEVEVIEKSN